MAAKSFKVLLFLTAGCAAAAATAYVFDVFDSVLARSLATHEALPGTDPKNARLPELGATVSPGDAPTAPAASQSPSFDLVRVESDGSIVIAGKARPYAKVEIDIGTRVIGSTVAAASGDFAIVIDEPLKPGGYQIVLRSIGPDNVNATSPETAVVSIPETKVGQVLVLIQQPGEPSRMVILPEMASMGPAASGQINAIGVAASVELSPAVPTGASRIAVEAVEIDGRAVFVAGMAEAGRQVRVYVDDVLLGDTPISPDGRFLLETERDLPVGNHILRVDALELDGMVVARAAVPFEREPGETVAAVAVRPTGDAAVPKEAAAGVNAEARTAAPKLQNVDSAVIIRRGDTLWRISRRVYGRGVRYSTIYLANQAQIRNPNRIWPGQVFTIPEKTPEGDPANMGAVDKQVATFKQ